MCTLTLFRLTHPLAAPCQMHVFRVFMVLTTCSRSFRCCLLPNRGWSGEGWRDNDMHCRLHQLQPLRLSGEMPANQRKRCFLCGRHGHNLQKTHELQKKHRPNHTRANHTGRRVTLVTTRVCACFQIKKKHIRKTHLSLRMLVFVDKRTIWRAKSTGPPAAA